MLHFLQQISALHQKQANAFQLQDNISAKTALLHDRQADSRCAASYSTLASCTPLGKALAVPLDKAAAQAQDE